MYPPQPYLPPPPARRQLQPYLGPRATISLSWLSQPFLALLLLVVSLIFLLSTLSSLVASSKSTYSAACQGVQGSANGVMSMPHYMADGVNEMNAAAVDFAVRGLATVVDVSLQSIEAIAIFIIDMYRSLYLCLLDLAVHGSLTLLVAAIEEVQSLVTSAFQTVRDELQEAVAGVDDALAAAVTTINLLPGVDIDAPTITLPDLNSLSNVTIGSSALEALNKLNSTIPTLDELRATLDSLISTPIDSLRASANASLSNATLDVDLLPVPAMASVDLCSDLDTSFIDDIGNTLHSFLTGSIAVVIVLIVLLIVLGAWWERRRYAAYLESIHLARDTFLFSSASAQPSVSFSDPNLLSFISSSSSPFRTRVLIWVTSRFNLPPDRRTNLIWFFSYIFHPNAVLFLVLGLVGLLLIQVQLAVLEGPVKDAAMSSANGGASSLSDQMASKVNAHLEGASYSFANESNALILGVQNGVNDDLFGWVNTTTTAMNNTLVAFYDGLTSSITDFFNDTPLNDIALQLVYCLIGSKVEGLETALTFIHEHAHLTLPTVSPTVFMLSTNRTADLASDLTNPNSSYSTTSIVDKMVDKYAEVLRQQRLAYVVCVLLWVLVVFFGLIGVFWANGGGDKWESVWGAKRRPVDRDSSFKDAVVRMSEKPTHSPLLLTSAIAIPTTKPSLAPQYTFPAPGEHVNPSRSFHLSKPSISVGNLFRSHSSDSLRSPSPPLPPAKAQPSFPPSQPSIPTELQDFRTGLAVPRSYPSAGGNRIKNTFSSLGNAVSNRLSRRSHSSSSTPLSRRRASSASFVGGLGTIQEHDDAASSLTVYIPVTPPFMSSTTAMSSPSLNVLQPTPANMSPMFTTRQPSSYQPTSGRNPFLTPFDDPEPVPELGRWTYDDGAGDLGAKRSVDPFASPFDAPGER